MATEETQPPAGAAADWTIPQGWDRYSPDEHAMWDQLFARQSRMLPGRVRRQVDRDDRHGACRASAALQRHQAHDRRDLAADADPNAESARS
jgi:hypothetical protein